MCDWGGGPLEIANYVRDDPPAPARAVLIEPPRCAVCGTRLLTHRTAAQHLARRLAFEENNGARMPRHLAARLGEKP